MLNFILVLLDIAILLLVCPALVNAANSLLVALGFTLVVILLYVLGFLVANILKELS